MKGFENCLECDVQYAVGTNHFCPPATEGLTATPNIVPHPIHGITKENLLEKSPDVEAKWAFKDPQPMILATSDDRVVNNVMRHEYKVLTEEQKHEMKSIKDHGLLFYQYLDALGFSRELSIAKTKIEEAVFWAVKNVTN